MKKFSLLLFGIMALAVVTGCEPPTTPGVTPDVVPAAYAWEGPGRHVVMFSATDCRPCLEQKPQFEALGQTGLHTYELDRDRNREIFQHYGVHRTPTYIAFEDGVEIKRTESVGLLILALKALVWVAYVVLF